MTFKNKILSNNFINGLLNAISFLFFKTLRFLYSRKRPDDSVLIIVIHKLGDSLFTFFAIEGILQLHKEKKITLLAHDYLVPLFRLKFGDNIKYITITKNDFRFSGKMVTGHFRKKINSSLFSTVYDLTGSVLTSSLLYDSPAGRIIGVNEKLFRGVYDEYYPNSFHGHLSGIYLQTVKSTTSKEIPFDYKADDIIFIHPTAGSKAKEWGLNKFIELYRIINKSYKTAFLISKDTPQLYLDQLRNEGIAPVISSSIDDLISALRDCALLISNDTGPIHLAAYLGKPTFTIYGPTNPKFHMPSGQYHRFIQKQIHCTPKDEKYCYTMGGVFCDTLECMKILSVNDVYQELNNLIIDINLTEKNGN